MDVIFLNGASSCGKTSIVKALQSLLSEPYLHIGIDKFLGMMPEKTNDWVGETVKAGFYWQAAKLADQSIAYRIRSGEYGKKINQAYRQTTANLAQMGLKLIIDDVIDGNEELQLWKILLKPYKTIYVGVYCDENILKIREKARGNRKIGSAIEQQQRVHMNIEYDFKLNTTNISAIECAQAIIAEMEISD